MPASRIAWFVTLVVASASLRAGPADDAAAALDRWAAALAANDATGVARAYADDAVLMYALDPGIDRGKDAIHHHFVANLRPGNKVTFGERHLMVLGDGAVVATGAADVVVVRAGKIESLPARFSFVMAKRGSDWLIAHQHLSRRPAGAH